MSPVSHDPPRIHEAVLAGAPSGAVLKGSEIDFDAAVARRRAGLDIVVCGNDLRENRKLAGAIETTVGPATPPQKSHQRAGPLALPHFHQQTHLPAGHSFYETDNPRKKAKKAP
jgi:hypothetical protein